MNHPHILHTERRDNSNHTTRERKTKSHKRKTKKPKSNLPKRALSAYNVFFQEQRKLILQERSSQSAPPDPNLFASMAQTIAKRWKALQKSSPDEIARCQEIADQDYCRYAKEMDEYQANNAAKNKQNPQEESSPSFHQGPTSAFTDLRPQNGPRLDVPLSPELEPTPFFDGTVRHSLAAAVPVSGCYDDETPKSNSAFLQEGAWAAMRTMEPTLPYHHHHYLHATRIAQVPSSAISVQYQPRPMQQHSACSDPWRPIDVAAPSGWSVRDTFNICDRLAASGSTSSSSAFATLPPHEPTFRGSNNHHLIGLLNQPDGILDVDSFSGNGGERVARAASCSVLSLPPPPPHMMSCGPFNNPFTGLEFQAEQLDRASSAAGNTATSLANLLACQKQLDYNDNDADDCHLQATPARFLGA